MAKSITDLRNSVNESAQIISNQLQGVESNLLGAFIAVIAAAFISNALGIIEYWAPASFILMWIIMINSFVRSYIPPLFRKRDRPEWTLRNWVSTSQLSKWVSISQFLKELFKQLFSERNVFLFITRCKNLVPILRAIGIIFFICFISLVMLAKGTIGTSSGISITIPIITSLFLILLPILWHVALPKIEKSELKTAFSKIGEIGRFSLFGMLFGIFFWILFTSFAVLVLPIWSLVKLSPMYEYNLSALGSWFIVLILVSVTALTLMNYFSASMVRKEMTIALYNLSNILNRINNEVALNQTVNEELCNELESDYVKAKRYEISADDTLMVNFYSLALNKTYLSTLEQKQSETKPETSE